MIHDQLVEQVERALAPFARIWELLRAARLEGEIAKHSWLKQMHEATGYSSIEFCNASEALTLIRAALAHSGETDAGGLRARRRCEKMQRFTWIQKSTLDLLTPSAPSPSPGRNRDERARTN